MIYAAFKMTLSVCARMNDSERRHLLMWIKKMLKDGDKKARLRLADRIADVYGKPAGFARKVRHILWERNISNKEFAHMLGTTAKHVSQWLNGDSSPSRAYRLKVAHVLDLDLEEIDSVDRDSIAG
ncbi:MAG: helix-turn-helix transcriptional regulator [Planctomycetota bacterium]|nr:helix-turn-helix transcriptional regulator [Planctomycetota bacterium]